MAGYSSEKKENAISDSMMEAIAESHGDGVQILANHPAATATNKKRNAFELVFAFLEIRLAKKVELQVAAANTQR